MKHTQYLATIFAFLVCLNAWSQSPSATVDVTLNPTGDFTITPSKVTGHATKKGDTVMAENILVEVKNLKTKIALRDKHVKERLQVDKFPNVKLIKATGKNGKGQGVMELKGKKVAVSGTYKISGSTLQAQFKIHLPDVGITDVSYMGVGVEDDVTVKVNLPIK